MDNKTKKNFNDIPLTDLDYKGVIYEPSENAKSFQKNKKIYKTKKSTPKPKVIKKQASNFNFNLFLGLTIGIGAVIFIITLSLTYSSISSYVGFPQLNFKPTENPPIASNNKNELILDSSTNENITGIIQNIDYETNLFTLMDINTNKVYTLKTKASSIFKNKYDSVLTISELSIGSIVDFSFDDSNKINYITENTDAFMLKNVSYLKIDTKLKTLNINNKTFKISDNVITLKNNELYDLSDISSLDIVDIKGYKDTIYYMDIKKGNGTLKLINKPNLNNAIIEIDRDIFKSLDAIDNISLSEGKHKVVIRSSDSISFVKEVEITGGNDTILDLAQIQNKSTTLFITSNVSDYTLYINNKIENITEPLKLPYGTYNIRAEKEGYTPFETQISISTEKYNLNINLEKIEKVGKMIISSNPDNAGVFVNNQLVGYTPLTYKLPQGVHTITLKKEGYNDFVLSSVTIGEEESSFNITMHKSQNQNNNTTSTNTNTETTVSEPTI